MSFGTPYPYGTPGGQEVITTSHDPPIIRVAQGNTVIVFLHANGRLAERLRENVEDVVRILGLAGDVLVAIIARQDNVVRDSNAGDLSFNNGLVVTQIAPGVVSIEIGNDAITSAMLQDAIVQAVHLAPASVTNAAIATDAVTTSKIPIDAIVEAHIRALNVTNGKLADNAVDARVLADASVDLAALAPGVIPAPGMTLITERVITSTGSEVFNNVFSSAYDNYMIIGEISVNTASFGVNLRLRASGADNSASVYRHMGDAAVSTGAAVSIAVQGGAAINACSFIPAVSGGRALPAAFRATFHRPNPVDVTHITWEAAGVWSGADWRYYRLHCRHETNFGADGFTLFSSSLFSGIVRIYGFRNS